MSVLHFVKYASCERFEILPCHVFGSFFSVFLLCGENEVKPVTIGETEPNQRFFVDVKK